jgi:valyl-tRNA synthetase
MLEKNYDYKKSEIKWQEYWEKEEIYKFNQDADGEVFSIDTPPPYVSADHLHIGHAMSYTHADIIARYQRMKGKNVFLSYGF